MTYKLGSLFDGSGGFPLAGSLCGIEPAWASEVEPYPIAVTRTRFPKMKHLGDISKINGAEVEPVDIITFGSPCQDLSVAGKRAGLKHEANGDEETTRSGLFMEAVRIIKEMRRATNGRYPSFALWENVPGAFSSNKGEDFRIVCEELIKIVEPTAVMPGVPKNGWPYADSYCGDGWSLAYRVFDAQYWGVPQRRRRIHLVLDLRGKRAREVLFEREGVRGYFAKSGTPWQAAPRNAENSVGADDCESGVAYTLKIRSGCEGGGKGALVQTDKSATLATNNDQYLFQPVHTGIIDNIGGQAEYGYESKVNGTLRSAATGAIFYAIENHPADSRVNIDESGKVQTLTSRMGTGGGNVPMIMEPVLASGNDVSGCLMASGYEKLGAQEMFSGDYTVIEPKTVAIEGNGSRPSHLGDGYKESDKMYTLNATETHAVSYGISSYHSNAMLSDNPHSGIYEAKTSRTLDLNGGNPSCNQGGIAIVEPTAAYWDGGQVTGTLTANNAGGNQRMPDKDNFNCVIEAEQPAICCTTGSFMQVCEEVSPTLMARDYKDPNLVTVNYIVRRLTPTECARLQGFADRWGDIDKKDDFTDEEYRFWLEVRNTHATVIGGKEAKEYTKAQMLTWYSKLHTDSAEYKLWGNGIALPPALYCLQGIREALDSKKETVVEKPKAEEEKPIKKEAAIARVKVFKSKLSKQQYKTLSGQIKAGDANGALRGLDKLLRRRERGK